MKQNNRIQAIIWDYDGTLVDTRQKNFKVTKKIVEKVTGACADTFFCLQSLDNYYLANKRTQNWRELYKKEFRLNDKQIDKAGSLWTEFQINDDTQVPFYDGIKDVISSLGDYPHGIVSQNSKSAIAQKLQGHDLLQYFKCIIGYEEVGLQKQKPAPDGLLMCIEKFSEMEGNSIFYIGDHETDMHSASNANQVLASEKPGIKILCIGAFYGSDVDFSNWSIRSDYEAHQVSDIFNIINRF